LESPIPPWPGRFFGAAAELPAPSSPGRVSPAFSFPPFFENPIPSSFISRIRASPSIWKRIDIFPLLPELRIGREEEREEEGGALRGKTIVITGNLTHFENRKELEEEILRAGGKCSGSVSKKTSYLVNNDSSSQSGKNKKAKELGIPIVTEEEFLKILGESRESAQGD